ncbi:MAG TPA: hypothetical protein VFR21_16265, partial [Bradyrhizobium sp.]|nr:hypothetical protein [Bradyrhizobium sp.]
MSSLARPIAFSRWKSSISTCAILAVADLCPTLTTHSLKTAESTNVSRQNKPITFGRALVNALIA